MADSRSKRFGKGPSDAKIRILPIEQSSKARESRTGEGESPSLSDSEIEDLMACPDNRNLGQHLGQRMAQHLKDHPEQVKRLFSSWLEEEEN